ncbi:hypothetical protein [Antrihabitans sp. YC2-6]|uniref:hypothetical protein n=1 Tax=Antrihabitans sp. YC2-6 TaxID=2799498 RepID=UPI0018F71E43|nr:hypothetical protein [Antrihabitans sp. YC2-6]MBJ8343930.1 hypothetical protein [Antrihabitans sp. YC2-6]
MSVDVAAGNAQLELPSQLYSFWCWNTAAVNVAISAADPTNPRIDTIVAWCDPTVTSLVSNNSPGSLKFKVVAGTPAGSPVAANDAAIQGSVGAGIAWEKLATAQIAALATTVTNANITDARTPIYLGVKLAPGALTTGEMGSSTVTSDKAATGFLVQRAAATFSSVATGTTVFPVDDTIPQNTEGVEYMTCAITPKSTTNILQIDATIMLSCAAAENLQAAIFQDTTANALAANGVFQASANGPVVFSVRHSMVAGTTGTTTFKVRAGAGSGNTVTFNGSGAARRYGAIAKSSLVITEYKA